MASSAAAPTSWRVSFSPNSDNPLRAFATMIVDVRDLDSDDRQGLLGDDERSDEALAEAFSWCPRAARRLFCLHAEFA
jgi:hypothetical protein